MKRLFKFYKWRILLVSLIILPLFIVVLVLSVHELGLLKTFFSILGGILIFYLIRKAVDEYIDYDI